MTHLWWRHVLWSGIEPTWSSIEVGFSIEVLKYWSRFSLKVIKGNKKSKFLKKQQLLHKQTIEIKQVKQMATLKYNYSSSQKAEFHPSLRVSRDHLTLQP